MEIKKLSKVEAELVADNAVEGWYILLDKRSIGPFSSAQEAKLYTHEILYANN